MGFSNNKEEIDVSYEDELNPKIIYSRLWLEENLDNPTLLNNFIYLFGYVDRFSDQLFHQIKITLEVLKD